MTAIVDVRAFAFDVPLAQPFGIAGGSQVIAKNVLVELEFDDGTLGLGEAAPFEVVSGETQTGVLTALAEAGPHLIGRDARRYRDISDLVWDLAAETPTAIAACEIALLDGLTRRAGMSLWHWFGGAQSVLRTDITISTSDDADPVAAAAEGARLAVRDGFDTLKIKVGKDVDTDARRVRAVHAAAPTTRLVLDANGSYQVNEALTLLRGLGSARSAVVLFEQPVAREAWEGLLQVQLEGEVLVCADESLRDGRDLAILAKQGGPGAINIKTAKSGLVRGWDLATSAQRLGFELMVGGMVETELSMSASACLAGGIGGVAFVDLDTPLFMSERPLRGGFLQRGPELQLAPITAGHGVSWQRP